LIFTKKTPFKGVFNQQLLTKIIIEILRENYVCVLIYYFNAYFFNYIYHIVKNVLRLVFNLFTTTILKY